MTYNLYVDLAFIWSFLVNTVLIYISDRILGFKLEIKKILPYALIISLLCTFEYIVCIDKGMIIQDILYVSTYIILLKIMYRIKINKNVLPIVYAMYIRVSLAIAAALCLMNYSIKHGAVQFIVFIAAFVLLVPAFYISNKYIKYRQEIVRCTHQIAISLEQDEYITYGYYDTGNVLNASGLSVIVCDTEFAGHILKNDYKEILDTYEKTGYFDYIKANRISHISFVPVPYRTINSNFCMMPGIDIRRLRYMKSKKNYNNIRLAISAYPLKLGENVHILLNDSLKP